MALQTKTVSVGEHGIYSWSRDYVITLTLTEQSVDVERNTSRVGYLFAISNGDSDWVYSWGHSWNISIGGQQIAIEDFAFYLMNDYTNQTIATGEITVAHNPDGSLEMPYEVSVPEVRSQENGGPPQMQMTGTWELTPIPRGAEVFCPDGTIGHQVEVSVTGLGSGLYCRLSYVFGGLEGVIEDVTADGPVIWKVPEDFYWEIPESREGICSVYATTYSGDVPVGARVWECVMTVDEDAVALTLQGHVEDINTATIALTGDPSRLVRYCSDGQVSALCEGKGGAYIPVYEVTHRDDTDTENPLVISGVEDGRFRFFAIDSRGFSAECEVEAEVVPYILLTCSLGDDKPDGEGNMTLRASGNYYNGSFGAADNDIWVQYRYKAVGAEYGEWQDMSVSPNAESYDAVAHLTGLDYRTAYTFQVRAMDKLMVAISAEYTVRAAPIFDWDENDFNVNGALKINGQEVADYVVARGAEQIWTWEKWASGVARCWGSTAEKTFTFAGDGPVYGSNIVHAVSYPFTFTRVDSANVNIMSDSGCVVPVVCVTEQVLSMSAIRLFGGKESVQGRYSIVVTGRWKEDT